MVHVHLDERPRDDVLLVAGPHRRHRLAVILVGDERHRRHLQSTVDKNHNSVSVINVAESKVRRRKNVINNINVGEGPGGIQLLEKL